MFRDRCRWAPTASLRNVLRLIATGLAGAGLILSFVGMSTAAAAVRPPGPPPAGVIKGPSGPLAPGLYQLASSQHAVTVGWYDRSSNEQNFVVYKRNLQGAWQQVYEVASRNVAQADGDYSWVDTDHSVSGQCYMVAAVNADGAGYTSEECTVRPDPSQFPQSPPPQRAAVVRAQRCQRRHRRPVQRQAQPVADARPPGLRGGP